MGVLGGLRLHLRATSTLGISLLLLGCVLFVGREVVPYSAFSYITRPLWDSSEAPSQHIAHYTFDPSDKSRSCLQHGWSARDDQPEVWDAIVFSSEVELLLVRLYELDPVVSRFFIIESDHSFSGRTKTAKLNASLSLPDFDPYRHKITYTLLEGRKLERGESPFSQENDVRYEMNQVLRNALSSTSAPSIQPILLFTDLDEIPRRNTIQLLQACRFGTSIHLGLREYVYSFQWRVGGDELGIASWRASVVRWTSRTGDAGAGEFYPFAWCFRTLDEFKQKAQGFSHLDRLGPRPQQMLKNDRLQRVICEGVDIFSMLPEAYSWREMAAKWRLRESMSAWDLPSLLVDDPERFPWLLPGNCERE
ncbi:glycosyltransferase family 17 protein [Meredithblackwellia eburnea MCA 4105]